MTVIVDIDHEIGDLSEYTSTVEDSGDLSVESGAALAGTGYGLQLNIDDTVVIYGIFTLQSNNTSGVLRVRFYIDPNDMTIGDGDSFFVQNCLNNLSSTLSVIELQYDSGVGYGIKAAIRDDANAYHYSSTYTISNAEHYIEYKLIRATNSGSGDGSIQLWVDGVDKETVASIDNYDKFSELRIVHLGAYYGIESGTTGFLYLDELIVNDDGGEIGPLTPSTLSASTSDGLTLGESMQSVASLGNIDVALDNANYQGRGVRIR